MRRRFYTRFDTHIAIAVIGLLAAACHVIAWLLFPWDPPSDEGF
jgi:hypothetical protein